MKKITIILTVIAIILFIVLIISFSGRNKQALKRGKMTDSAPSAQIAQTAEISNKYKTQTKAQANVTVDVTPKQLGTGEKNNVFALAFNTHSVPLEFDFAKIIVLKDNLGNSYSATKWTGQRGGHHLKGDIIFPKINQGVTSVSLEINDINGAERTFTWNLQ